MTAKEAFNKAAALCSASEKCAGDILKKLQLWGINPNDQQSIIDGLKREKFIDHNRYALYYVRDKFRFNKWGRRKIEFELRHKGIEDSIIAEAIKNIDEGEYSETVLNTLEQKLMSLRNKDYYQIRASLIRYGLSKGYDSGLVFDLVDKILKNRQNP